jgi:hypothetical protein
MFDKLKDNAQSAANELAEQKKAMVNDRQPKTVIKKFWEADTIGGLGIGNGGSDIYTQFTYDGKKSTDRGDPTYMGFSVKFDMLDGYYDFDSLPCSLFMGGDGDTPSEFSTQNYLQQNGYAAEAMHLKRFRQGLNLIQTEKPWFFTGITGLDTLYKIDTTKPGRASADAKISLSMLENLNMEVTYLFDFCLLLLD